MDSNKTFKEIYRVFYCGADCYTWKVSFVPECNNSLACVKFVPQWWLDAFHRKICCPMRSCSAGCDKLASMPRSLYVKITSDIWFGRSRSS